MSRLVFELSKLPGVGEKTATRLAYHLLRQDPSYCQSLADAILSAKKKTNLCTECFTFTETPLCKVCSSDKRNRSLICIVEQPTDVYSIEQTGQFDGVYHVLHGVVSPLDGIGPDDIRLRELLPRVKAGTEVILATNPSVEGDATALYIAQLIRPLGVHITKLAHGLPAGGRLEFSDRQTIHKALENRMEMQ